MCLYILLESFIGVNENERITEDSEKSLNKNRHHQPKAAVEGAMIRGRGIINVMELGDRQIHNMRKNFHKKMEENAFIWKRVKLGENLTSLNLQH